MSNEPTPKTDNFLSRNSSYMEKRAYMMELEREFTEVTKQRDALAEALQMITSFDYTDMQCDNGYGCRSVANEALQSLTRNEL